MSTERPSGTALVDAETDDLLTNAETLAEWHEAVLTSAEAAPLGHLLIDYGPATVIAALAAAADELREEAEEEHDEAFGDDAVSAAAREALWRQTSERLADLMVAVLADEVSHLAATTVTT